MVQNITIPEPSILDRFHTAGTDLATTVDVIDRAHNDPDFPGDTSLIAHTSRQASLEAALVEFRAAKAALYESQGIVL